MPRYSTRRAARSRPLASLGAIVAASILATAAPLQAQHPLAPSKQQHEQAIPKPRDVLGYELGERFTPHHLVHAYFQEVARRSPRVRLDTLGRTFEGREVIMAVVTSEANHSRMDAIRADLRTIADPREAGNAADAAASRVPAVAWMGYTVHGNEASGTEAAIGLLYQLAAGQDDETRMVLDSTVVLIDPIQNPDGHERHVHYTWRMRGASGISTIPGTMSHGSDWPGARTSHYYFDLNRDWFIHSHPETRARVGVFLDWAPHVAVDLHEMGSNSTYFFAPPMEPVNKNVDESILRWWDIYAAANAAAFDSQGWPYFRREGYDEFYPGYGVSWPILNGAVGMTYEQASSSGGAIRRTDGTVLTLHQAASQHYAAAWATVTTTASRRAQRVRDFLEFRRSAVREAVQAPMRAVVFARDAQGRADSLAARLIGNGIEVRRLTSETTIAGATAFPHTSAPALVPAGSYVVDLAQPQGRLAKALLEPDAQLDSTFIGEEIERRRTGQGNRFYDITAWSLPYLFRVDAWRTRQMPAGAELVTSVVAARNAAPARAQHAYAVAPGSETSLRFIAGVLSDGIRVWFAPRPFRTGGEDFPKGAWLVRVAANPDSVHDVVMRRQAETGARVVAVSSAMVDEGTDLGSNSVMHVRMPKVALLGGSPVNGNSFGFAWYALDQRLGYPTAAMDAAALTRGVIDEFNVLIIPSAFGNIQGALGEAGMERLQRWVREGGVLITLDGATSAIANERSGLSRLRPLQASAGRDTASAGAPLPVNVPGAAVRAVADTLSPLMAGVNNAELAVMVSGSSVLAVPDDVRPGEAVLRLAPRDRLRISGYLWPEAWDRLPGAAWLWTERVGQGRVISFAGDPNYRDLWRGLHPVFANAVLLGGSF